MVVLRNKSHHEHRLKKTELRSSERQRHNNSIRSTAATTTTTTTTTKIPDRNRKSPRRTRSEKKSRDVVKLERVPTPLAEKRNEEEFAWSVVVVERERELAIRAAKRDKEMTTMTDRNRRSGLLSPEPSRTYSRTRSCKGKAENGNGNGKATEGGSRSSGATVDGDWGENESPAVKRPCLDDDVPLIVECWQ
ncbi:hypothetical protein F5B17DRAFT_423160 [Nemania serpens]|nr:hypothetical protein F5B17DRAFT_423160 [Nemania serpens]